MGCLAASADEAFAVGGDPLAMRIETLSSSISKTNSGAECQFSKPSKVSKHSLRFGGLMPKMFMVGANGIILHFDGNTWRQQASGTARDFISLWGSGPNDILAVGGRANGLIARFDGAKWTHKVLTGEPGMNGIWMNSEGQATVVGGRGRILSFAKGSMDYVRQKADNRLLLHGVWGTASGERFAVGGTLTGTSVEGRGDPGWKIAMTPLEVVAGYVVVSC